MSKLFQGRSTPKPDQGSVFEKSLGLLNDKVRITNRFRAGGNKVLMYHSIGGGFVHNISASQFRRQMQRLDASFELVDLPEVVDDDSDDNRIAVTFDDGFSDFYTGALPVLEEFGVPATVFVIEEAFADAGFVHDPGRNYSYMSESEVLELADHDLVTLGNHTSTHPDLTEIETDELEDEITGAKHRLEDRFGVDIDRFAYPYNKFDRNIAEVVRESHSFAVCRGPRTETVTPHTDPCLIPRMNGAVAPSLLEWRMTDFSTNFGALYSSFRRNVEDT